MEKTISNVIACPSLFFILVCTPWLSLAVHFYLNYSPPDPPQASPTPPGGYCKDLQVVRDKLKSYTESGSMCYYYFPFKLTHTFSSRICENQGGKLASLHKYDLNNVGLSSSAWIGMRKNLHSKPTQILHRKSVTLALRFFP